MIVIDINLLIYASIPAYPQHPEAYQWFLKQLRENPRIGLPWSSLLGFVRLAINPKLHQKPIPIQEALKQISDWLSLENTWVPEPTPNHLQVLSSILDSNTKDPNLIPDAHLAALAIEHGLTVCSADNDFGTFKQINWFNPISKK